MCQADLRDWVEIDPRDEQAILGGFTTNTLPLGVFLKTALGGFSAITLLLGVVLQATQVGFSKNTLLLGVFYRRYSADSTSSVYGSTRSRVCMYTYPLGVVCMDPLGVVYVCVYIHQE